MSFGLLTGLAACASQSSSSELQARRTDLAAVGHALIGAEEPIQEELAAARMAWPLIDRGLPRPVNAPADSPAGRASKQANRRDIRARERTMLTLKRWVRAAATRAQLLPPALVVRAAELTGAGSEIAGVYELSSGLIDHGWAQIEATLAPANRDSPAARAFLRANVDTYIISVYDGNFDLSLVGKMLKQAYKRLGGAERFGRTLTPAQVADLSRAYSPTVDRLRPHPWQRLVTE
jgi:hypothetical protein